MKTSAFHGNEDVNVVVPVSPFSLPAA